MPDITTPPVLVIPKTPLLPYLWATFALAALGAALVMSILWIRPTSDPLAVIEEVVKPLLPTLAAVFAFMKAQQTHLSVNSRLTAFMQASVDAASAKGQLKGVADEQARTRVESTPDKPTPIR